MRTLLTSRLFSGMLALAVCCTLSGSSLAGDHAGFSIQQVGHSHHGHHGHYYGGYHGHRHYGYRPSVSLRIGFGSVYGGYGSCLPYRTSYYVDPYCYGPAYYRSSYSICPYGIYYGAGSSPRYYLPPTVQPAELAYGPQAVKQFMGVDRDFALGDLKRDDPKLVLGNVVANRVEPKVRETNWEARRRALTFMNRGDEAFAQGQYAAALADYDKAVLNAPDVAIAYVRQAFALLAAGNHEQAAASLERAVTIDPEVVQDIRFEANDLYQGNQQAQQQHLENLAQAALAAPGEGHFLVLLGAMLHYDRQILRAEKFFQQAVKVGGAAGETARAFLPEKQGAI